MQGCVARYREDARAGLATCRASSRIASLVKTAGSLQSLSDHSTYTIQRWTSGAARYCLPGETRGLPLPINLSVRSNSGGNE